MILKDVGFVELAQLVEYMYTGQICVRHQDIHTVLQAAQVLQVYLIRSCVDIRIYIQSYRQHKYYRYI